MSTERDVAHGVVDAAMQYFAEKDGCVRFSPQLRSGLVPYGVDEVIAGTLERGGVPGMIVAAFKSADESGRTELLPAVERLRCPKPNPEVPRTEMDLGLVVGPSGEFAAIGYEVWGVGFGHGGLLLLRKKGAGWQVERDIGIWGG